MVPDTGHRAFSAVRVDVKSVFAIFLAVFFARVTIAAAGSCSFESGICQDWLSSHCSIGGCFKALRVANMSHGPARDHTLMEGDGWCAYATMKPPRNTTEVAQLWSTATGPFCFTAWYHQWGTRENQAKFLAYDPEGAPNEFYETQLDMDGRWQRVRYSEKRTGKLRIIIRTFVQIAPEIGVFALDDLSVESGECASERPSGSCDFDWGDTCGYSLENNSDKWTLASAGEFSIKDYSTNSFSGGFVYFSSRSEFLRGLLTSPQLPGSMQNLHCLQFRYYIDHNYQPQDYLLSVIVQEASARHQAIWTRRSKELIRGVWTTADVAFQARASFKIMFQCVFGEKKYTDSMCAIDAIRVRGCRSNREMRLPWPTADPMIKSSPVQPVIAAKENFCDFEDGWCTWRNRLASLYRAPWILGGGNTKTTFATPTQDHTFGNSTGSYLLFSNFQQTKGKKAELMSEILPQSNKITLCAEFWYIISEDPETSLEVQAFVTDGTSGTGTPLWQQKGSGSPSWEKGRIAVPHNRRVTFVGTAGVTSIPGYIALDDISIVHTDWCETLPPDGEILPATELLSCPLAGWDFCHWSSSAPLSETWSFGLSPSSSLAPASLPGNSKGNVAYLKGVNVKMYRRTVLLYSPLVGPQSELACFSAWYHMFGSRGTTLWLTVAKSPSWDLRQRSLPLFVQEGRTAADIWYNVRKTVILDGVHNKLVFTVSSEQRWNRTVDLALGPVNLTSGKCDVLTDALGYCDFEFDTCDWVVESGWQRDKKSSALFSVDSISGPVNSVYTLTANPQSVGPSEAVVTSPEWKGQNEPQCLEFWYSSAGSQSARLQVEVMSSGRSEVVWEQPQFAQREWMLERVEILQEKEFKVLFRAKFPKMWTQSVSVDDIALRPEPCPHPADCEFLDGLCGYVNKFQGDFRWLVGTGRYEIPKLQPPVPREEDSPLFAYLDLTTGRSDASGWAASRASAAAKTVGLLSPLFDVGDERTIVSIRHYINGSDITSANVSVSCYGNSSDGKRAEAKSAIQFVKVPHWSVMLMELKRGTRCQLAVWVTRGDGTDGVMAIAYVRVTHIDPVAALLQDFDSPVRCSFEDGTMCGWKPGKFSIKWALSDHTKKSPVFPRSDHTFKSYTGRFAFASQDKDIEPQHAILDSPDLDVNATAGACLSFWVFTVRSRHVNLDVWSGVDRLFSTITRHGHQWDQVLVDFKRPKGKFKLRISFYLEPGLVALDDIQVNSGSCPQKDFCSWEVGSPCPVIPAPNNYDEWKVRRALHIGFADHTIKDLTGRYLYLNTTAVDSHHPVSRVFMQRRPPTEATCVTFWWSGQGVPSRLNVYRFTTERALNDPLVSVSSHTEDGRWSARAVTVTSTREWNLVFEGVAAGTFHYDSGVMIDDVEFADGDCPPYEFCSFEDECLIWTVEGNDEASFEVERAGSFEELPKDHTTRSEDGYYLLYKSAGEKGNRTSLVLLNPTPYHCLSLWYYMPDISDGVELYVLDRELPKSGGSWKRYEVDLWVIWDDPIFALPGLNPKGFVAIDDILVSETVCKEKRRNTDRFDCGNQTIIVEKVCDFVVDCDNGADERGCGECDFTEGSCGWNSNAASNFGPTSWGLREIGSVENSPHTGADGRRHGHYLLLHTNGTNNHDISRAARLDSPVIRNTNKLCTLTFWYNYAFIDGIKMDVVLNMNVRGYTFEVWKLDALADMPEERTWNEAVVEIGRYRSALSFFFNSGQYPQSKSVFAIDEIDYADCALPARNGNCNDKEFSCHNGACVMKYERCNYVDDCGDNTDELYCDDYRLSCNFDYSFCDWMPQASLNGTKENIWRLARPGRSLLHSPTRDHTTGSPNGKFVIFQARSKVENAVIVGPTIDNSSYCAVTFFYAMRGNSKPHLSLAIRSTKGGPWKTVWKQSRISKFFNFVGLSVEFKSVAPYQVAFIGEHTSPEKDGYIAIDDVHFWESCKATNQELPAAPAPTVPSFTCGENEVRCGGLDKCVQQSQLCDFKADCPNGDDESRCGFCDFSVDLCGLENLDSSARHGWNWTRVQDGKKKKGFPATDSRLNDQGAYASYTLLNLEAPEGSKNALVSPQMGEIAHSCVITFYAYIPNEEGAQLIFDLQHRSANPVGKQVFKTLAVRTASGATEKWIKVQVKTGNWKAGAQFVYIAKGAGVSIDNPEYKMCHPDWQNKPWEDTRQVSCDFSNPEECGWFPEHLEDDAEWLPGAPEHLRLGISWRPLDSDPHKGAYLYATNGERRIKTARVVSVKMRSTPVFGRCFTFWYNLWHPEVGTLKLLRRVDNASTDLLWMREAPQGKEWKQGRVQFYSGDPHQLVFEAVLKSRTSGVIAINDFVLKDDVCDDSGYDLCDFEPNSCGWKLHNWRRVTPRSVSVPTADHSTQSPSGNFVLAKAPGGRLVSSKRWHDLTKFKCLRFWFFISGTSREAMNVTAVLDEDKQDYLWYGTAADAPKLQWASGSANLPTVNKFQAIVFEALTSGDPGSAVAVDDISLHKKPCPPPGSCTFDEDMCNWYNSEDPESAKWYRHRGATNSNLTGIEKDHTLGTKDGYYLLLDAAGPPAGSFHSQPLSFGPAVCLRLYYVMRQNSMASLVIAFMHDGRYTRAEITTVESTAPSQWTLLTVEATELPPVFTVAITGWTGSGRTDVAIDDIDIRPGTCEKKQPTTETPVQATTASGSAAVSALSQRLSSQQPVSTEPSPPAEVVTEKSATSETPATSPLAPVVACKHGEFKCPNENACIPGSLLCDGVKDCTDGLDEKCGGTSTCKENEFFCVTRSPSACLPRSLLCDGTEDCIGGSDESLCGACPPYFCLNGGTCRWTPFAQSPTCECHHGYKGVRCQATAGIVAQESKVTEKASGSAGAVTATVIVLAVIIVVAVAVFMMRRRRLARNSPVFIDNPVYNASTDTTRLFNRETT